ncbi:MAG: hypothetical protein FJZ01_25530, partial [Candidatus Sericytochromatia bacterium]|nr:hypothetical protein [Candidatus Tanganyikabacteria bacterium]
PIAPPIAPAAAPPIAPPAAGAQPAATAGANAAAMQLGIDDTPFAINLDTDNLDPGEKAPDDTSAFKFNPFS